MTAVPKPSTYRLEVGDLRTLPVSVARAPYVSVLRLLAEVPAPPQRRSPIASALAQNVSPNAAEFISAIGMPGLDRMPDVLTQDPQSAESVAGNVSRLRSLDTAELVRQIDALWGGRPPTPWRNAAERPRRWLDGAARASLQAWALLSRHWNAAAPSLRREEARIGTAVVTGSLDVLISEISPRLRVHGGSIEFDNPCGKSVPIGDRRLVFVPMLTSRRQVVVSFEDPDVAYIGYQLPGGVAQSPQRPLEDASRDRLISLLGPIRAAALRTLHRPQTMGTLAQTLHCSPSTLTYHCDLLTQTGLIQRRRRGQSIWVSRTDRALRLLDALE